MDMTEARSRAMGRMECIDSQGAEVTGADLSSYVAFFDGVEPPELAAKAVISLIEDGTLSYDPYTDRVGIA